MKTTEEQIIAKQEKIIINLKEVGKLYFLCKDHSTKYDLEKMKALYKEAERLESELSALKVQAEQEKSTNRELFEKVYIRSEADLPKEDGNYICHHTGAKENEFDSFPFKIKESHWFVKIDWYLRPIEAVQLSNNRLQSESSTNNLKTAEEILKDEMSENLWTFICSYPVSYKSEEKLVEWIIDAMQEYAAQFKQEKVTDEDIEKWMMYQDMYEFDSIWDAIRYGAKAMRDGLIQYKKD